MQTATVPVEAELDAPVDRIASPDVGGVLPVAHASKPLDAASPVETRADAFEARPPMAVSCPTTPIGATETIIATVQEPDP